MKSGAVLPLLMGGGGGGEASLPQNSSHDFLGEGNGGRVAMRKGTAMPAGVQVCVCEQHEAPDVTEFLWS